MNMTRRRAALRGRPVVHHDFAGHQVKPEVLLRPLAAYRLKRAVRALESALEDVGLSGIAARPIAEELGNARGDLAALTHPTPIEVNRFVTGFERLIVPVEMVNAMREERASSREMRLKAHIKRAMEDDGEDESGKPVSAYTKRVMTEDLRRELEAFAAVGGDGHIAPS